MKLVKKILRLFPFINFIIIFIFSYIQSWLVFNQTGVFDSEVFNNIILNYFSVFENELVWFFNTPLSGVYDWFTSITGGYNSGILLYIMIILSYELFISLFFLCFDFINMIFSWTNKLMNKGGNLDD